jgi:hypothetical protein
MDTAYVTRVWSGNSMQDPTGKHTPCPDGGELDVEEAFFGDHEIEYWVARDGRLAPAAPDELASIHAWEHERALAAVRSRHLGLWRRTRVMRLFAGAIRRVRRTRLAMQSGSPYERHTSAY